MPGIARPGPPGPTRALQTEVPAFAGMTRWITFLDWGRQMVDYGRYVVYLLASRKLALIEKTNPDRNDLFDSIVY